MRTSKTKKSNLIKMSATFLVAFFIFSGGVGFISSTSAISVSDVSGSDSAPVSISVSNSPLAYYISVSSSHGSAGSPVSLSYTMDGSGNQLGNVVSSSDLVTIDTNSPMSHQLLLSTTSDNTTTKSNNLVGDNTQAEGDGLVPNTYIAPSSSNSLSTATALSSNTWGFALSNSTPGIATNNFDSDYSTVTNASKFTSVPAKNNEALVLEDTTATSTTTIYYGVLADRSLPAGGYSNTILYTALAEQPSEIRVCVDDVCSNHDDSTVPSIDVSNPRQTVKIYTSISTVDEDLGSATIKISSGASSVSCGNPTLSTVDNYIVAQCIAPNLTAGIYNVGLTLDRYDSELNADSAIRYENLSRNAFSEANLEYLQQMTSAICSKASSGDAFTLKDRRDSKAYSVAKLADGNCWLTQNLALDGGRILTPSDSNVTVNRTLPANIPAGTTASISVSQILSDVAGQSTSEKTADNTVVNGTQYGNWYNWIAATAGTGATITSGSVTPSESVCPKGWHLPDHSSFVNLFKAYNLPTANGDASGEDIVKVQNIPLYFSLDGAYGNRGNEIYNVGLSGYYWARTQCTNTTPYAFIFTGRAVTGNFYPYACTRGRENAFSVRCVFGS